jgi:hypothetical protein
MNFLQGEEDIYEGLFDLFGRHRFKRGLGLNDLCRNLDQSLYPSATIITILVNPSGRLTALDELEKLRGIKVRLSEIIQYAVIVSLDPDNKIGLLPSEA